MKPFRDSATYTTARGEPVKMIYIRIPEKLHDELAHRSAKARRSTSSQILNYIELGMEIEDAKTTK